jgi:hypothetical protein
LEHHPEWADPTRAILVPLPKEDSYIMERNGISFALAIKNMQYAAMFACLFHACAKDGVDPVLLSMHLNGAEVKWDWGKLLASVRVQPLIPGLPSHPKDISFEHAVALWAYTCGPGETCQTWHHVCSGDGASEAVVELGEGYSIKHAVLPKPQKGAKKTDAAKASRRSKQHTVHPHQLIFPNTI